MKRCLFLFSIAALLAACNTTGTPELAPRSESGTDTGLAISAGLDVVKAMTLTDAEVKSLGLRGVEESDKQAKVAPAKNKYAKRLVVSHCERRGYLARNLR